MIRCLIKRGAAAVHWVSEGGTEYEMQEGNRTEVGTEITLYLNEDSLAFANEYRAREVLEKYCSFMPVEIFLSKVNAEPEYETIDEADVLDTDEVVEHITEEPKEGEEGEPKQKVKIVNVRFLKRYSYHSGQKIRATAQRMIISSSTEKYLWITRSHCSGFT